MPSVADAAPSENHSVHTNTSRSQQSQSRQIQNVHLILEGDDLNPVGGWFSPTNPCVSLEASIATKSGSVVWQTVATSEIQTNTVQKVRWNEMVVPLAQLLLGSCANTPLLNNSSYLQKKFNHTNYLQKPIRIRVQHKDDDRQPVGVPMGYVETTMDNLLQASGDATRSAPLWQEDGTAYGKIMVRHARLQTQKVPSRRKSSVASCSRLISRSLPPASQRSSLPSQRKKSLAKRTTSLTNHYRKTQSNHQRSKARRTQSHGSRPTTSSGHRRSWHHSKNDPAQDLTTRTLEHSLDDSSHSIAWQSFADGGGNASHHSSVTRSSYYSIPMDILYQHTSVLQLTLEGFDFVDMGGWLGTTNPYFQVSIPTITTPQQHGKNMNHGSFSFTTASSNNNSNNNNNMPSSSSLLWQQVYRSEPVVDSLTPIWKSATIPLALLVGQGDDCDDSQQQQQQYGGAGHLDRIFRISFFSRIEAGSSEPPVSMGWLDTNILELKQATKDPTQELIIAEPMTDNNDDSDSINPNNRKKVYGKIRVLQAELPEELDVSVCSTSYSGSDGSMSIINSDVEVIEYGSSDDDSISIITHDLAIQTRADFKGYKPGASISQGGLEEMPEVLVEEDLEENQKSAETGTSKSGRHTQFSRETIPNANGSHKLNVRSAGISSFVPPNDLDMTDSASKAQPRHSLGSLTLSLNTDIDSDASDHRDRSSYIGKQFLTEIDDFEESRGCLPSSRKSLLADAASAAAQAVAASLGDLTLNSEVSSYVSKINDGDDDLKACDSLPTTVNVALDEENRSAAGVEESPRLKESMTQAEATINELCDGVGQYKNDNAADPSIPSLGTLAEANSHEEETLMRFNKGLLDQIADLQGKIHERDLLMTTSTDQTITYRSLKLELEKCQRDNLSVQEALEVAQASVFSNKAALNEAKDSLNTVRLENDVWKHNLEGKKSNESLHVKKLVEENEGLVEELMKARRAAESCTGRINEAEQLMAKFKSEKEVLLEHNSSLTITMREIQTESDLRVSRLKESASEKEKQIEEMRSELSSLRVDKSSLEVSLSRAQQESQEAWERLREQEEAELPPEARSGAQTLEINLAEIGMLDRRTLECMLVDERTKCRALEERLKAAKADSNDLRASATASSVGEGCSTFPSNHEQTSNEREEFSKQILRLTESVNARDRLVERAREEIIALQLEKESLQEALTRENLESKMKLDQINSAAIESARKSYETSLEKAEKKLTLYETSAMASAAKINTLSAENEELTRLASRLTKELSEISKNTKNDADGWLKERDKLAEEFKAVNDTAELNIKQIKYEKDAMVNACRILEVAMKDQEAEIQRLSEFKDLCGLDVSDAKAHRENVPQLQSEKEKLMKDLGTTQLKLAAVESLLKEKEAALLEKCDVIASLEDEKAAVERRNDDIFELGELKAARAQGMRKYKMLEKKVKDLEKQVTAAHFAKGIYVQYWKDANLKIKELQGTHKELKSIRKSIRLSTKGSRPIRRSASSKFQDSDDENKREKSDVEQDSSGKPASEGKKLDQGEDGGGGEALKTKRSRKLLKPRRSTCKVEKESTQLKIPTVQVQQMHKSKVKRASLRVRRPSSALKKRPSSNTTSNGDEKPRKSRAERSSIRKSIRETKDSTNLSQPPTIRERKKRRSVSDTRKIRRSTTSDRKHRKSSSASEEDAAEPRISGKGGETERHPSDEPAAQDKAESGAAGDNLLKESDPGGDDVAGPHVAAKNAQNTEEVSKPAGPQRNAGNVNDVGESINLPRSELMKLI